MIALATATVTVDPSLHVMCIRMDIVFCHMYVHMYVHMYEKYIETTVFQQFCWDSYSGSPQCKWRKRKNMQIDTAQANEENNYKSMII